MEHLSGDGLGIGHGELGKLVDSGAIDESTEDQEGRVAHVAHNVVITRRHLLRLILSERERQRKVSEAVLGDEGSPLMREC